MGLILQIWLEDNFINITFFLLPEALIPRPRGRDTRKAFPSQGCFLSSPITFTKPNFEGVISFPSVLLLTKVLF